MRFEKQQCYKFDTCIPKTGVGWKVHLMTVISGVDDFCD